MSFKKVLLAALNVGAFCATTAFAQPMTVDWIPNNQAFDGPSCVNTCQRYRGYPASSGYMNTSVNGDRSLYVCRAFAPGFEAYGERAGYNWTGSINGRSQPGCMVPSGDGSSLANNFDCLCEVSRRPHRNDH